jgi:hypothetical protein
LPGWTGDTCSQQVTVLNLGQVYTNQAVAQYQWRYFTVSSNSSAMLVSMRETETRGFLWLFMSQSGYPTLDAFEIADRETNTDFHEVHSVFETPEVRIFYIGVYGNPFGNRGDDGAPFSITSMSAVL